MEYSTLKEHELAHFMFIQLESICRSGIIGFDASV